MAEIATDQLIDLNTKTAELITESAGPLDELAAERLLRNTAVVADRLSARQFNGLGQDSIKKVLLAADIAMDLVPVRESDPTRGPDETEEEHSYRVRVLDPLRSLQRGLATGYFERSDDAQGRKVKLAVELGSEAFGAIVDATDDYPAVRNAKRYFWENADAAARRIK